MIDNKLFRKLAENFYRMKKIISTVILAAVIVGCNKSGGSISQGTDKLQNDDQKAGYAYGMNIGDQVKKYSIQMGADSLNFKEIERGLTDFLKNNAKTRDSYATGQNIGMSIANFLKNNDLDGVIDEKFIIQGLMDELNGKTTLFPMDSVNSFMTNYMQTIGDKIKTKNQEESAKFMAQKKSDKNVKSTESGLLYEVIKEGDGAVPEPGATVEVEYKGMGLDGKVFDQSEKGKPIKLNLNGVIKGWQEGLQLMKTGSKYKFYIPSELGYGEFGSPDGKIKPNAALIFEVELVSVEQPQKLDPANMPQIPDVAPGQ